MAAQKDIDKSMWAVCSAIRNCPKACYHAIHEYCLAAKSKGKNQKLTKSQIRKRQTETIGVKHLQKEMNRDIGTPDMQSFNRRRCRMLRLATRAASRMLVLLETMGAKRFDPKAVASVAVRRSCRTGLRDGMMVTAARDLRVLSARRRPVR